MECGGSAPALRPICLLLLAAGSSAGPHINLYGGGVEGEQSFQVDPSVVGNMKDGQMPNAGGMPVTISRKHAQIAEIYLGTPPQRLTCLIDSGSSDLWVPSKRCQTCQNNNDFNADASSTFQAEMTQSYNGPKPRAVKISYGSGDVVGYAATDTLKFGSVTIPKQPFIIVEDAALPDGRQWDGICGLGWEGIAQLSPTLYQSLQRQGQRAAFTVVPSAAGGAFPNAGMHLVLGDVPQQVINPATLVWMPAEAYDPTGGQMGQQRTFWMVSGGVQINAPQPWPARFLVDTGTNQVLLVPQKYYQTFIRSLIPSQYFDQYCGNDPGAGVVCDCTIQQVQGITPLKIYLGGRPFAMPLSKMFVRAKTTTGGEMCVLTMQPDTLGLGGSIGIGDLLGGLLGALFGPGGGLQSQAVRVQKSAYSIREKTNAGLANLPHLPFHLSNALKKQLPWFKEDVAAEDATAREAVIEETCFKNGQICRKTWVAEKGKVLQKDNKCGNDALAPSSGKRRLQQGVLGEALNGLIGGLAGSLFGNGQSPYGTDPYGQDPYGQNPYGQNPYGQNPYGQQQQQQQQQQAVDDEPWMIGGMFLEHFATIFDFDQGMMGFAEPAGGVQRRLAATNKTTGASPGRQHADILV